MKGIFKYILLAAVGYYVYNQYKKSQQQDVNADRPSGSGGTVRVEQEALLQSINGTKKLPYTY